MITTYTGRTVDPLHIKPEDVCIEDIAHALALCNRFAGHTRVPLSVAQHSVDVSRYCAGPFALQGLLHDASEAYLGDVTKWLKDTPEFAAYRKAEALVQQTIFQAFGCPTLLSETVINADRFMVRFEARQLMHRLDVPAHKRLEYPPMGPREASAIEHWQPWGWKTAEEIFLDEFWTLYSSKQEA